MRHMRPLLALERIFTPDKAGARENGAEGEERESVEVCVPGEGAVQHRAHHLAGLDGYQGPVEILQSVGGLRVDGPGRLTLLGCLSSPGSQEGLN